MDAGILDQHDAHESKSRCDVQILCGGLMPNTPIRLEQPMYSATLTRYGDIPFAVFAQQPDEEIVDGGQRPSQGQPDAW